jgi:PIN like domain
LSLKEWPSDQQRDNGLYRPACGKSIPHALKLLGVDAEAHLDHFAHNTHDDEWLAEVGRRGWVVFTYDKRIRYNQSERQAVMGYQVGCFMLTSGNRTKWEQMRILVKAWDRIQDVIANTTHVHLSCPRRQVRPNAPSSIGEHVRSSAPIHLVQATLGHASVATTGSYHHARLTDSSSKYLAV